MESVLATVLVLAFVGFLVWRHLKTKKDAAAYPKLNKDTGGSVQSDTDNIR